jgi:hypothetical protein
MTDHETGTREAWLAARLELLEAEKEHTRRSDELARRRQELPWVRIDKEYRFDTDEGPAALADLFRGRSQLIIYHFMFGPDPHEPRPVVHLGAHRAGSPTRGDDAARAAREAGWVAQRRDHERCRRGRVGDGGVFTAMLVTRAERVVGRRAGAAGSRLRAATCARPRGCSRLRASLH